jgi:hypothetical protein
MGSGGGQVREFAKLREEVGNGVLCGSKIVESGGKGRCLEKVKEAEGRHFEHLP